MSNDGQKPQGLVAGMARQNNGFFPNSFRSLSGYLRIVSSGASTVASTVRSAASAASSIVERNDVARGEQVLCAGFDKLECEDGTIRHILLLGCQSGFQVWDVEEADNVHDLVMRHDGAVCFLQMLPRPASSIAAGDKFIESRPLLVVCQHGSGMQEAVKAPSSESIPNGIHGPGSGLVGPFTVQFYSLTSQTSVHHLKFRTAVYSIRCSSRVIAILQASQIHCFNAATLDREYTIVTNRVSMTSLGSGGIGYGPLAVGPRWLAYSGSSVANTDSGRVSPQQLTSSASFANNGSVVAHYAKESSKQLAQGIVTLGDMGYKKLTRYYSELHPDANHVVRSAGVGGKTNGTINGHVPDIDSVGMVIVRDILNKSIITQFRAHKSPISALCFDPSGTLLVTASVHGHNINVFRIMPGVKNSNGCVPSASAQHLYRLQRGFTDAVIQDISFSDDSRWIMVGTSRGTNHLFAISSPGGSANRQSSDANNPRVNGLSETVVQLPPSCDNLIDKPSGPVTRSAVNRIRSHGNGWKGTAAAAAGRISVFSGVTATTFHQCRGGSDVVNAKTYFMGTCLLIFSPSGSLVQYSIRDSPKGVEPTTATIDGSRPRHDPAITGSDSELIVEAVKKWNISQKQRQRDRDNGFDIYGEKGNPDYNKVFPDEGVRGMGIYSVDRRGGFANNEIISEEKRNLYISQAELHMHPRRVPFWAKSGIYFEAMIPDGAKMEDDESEASGEFEIERFSTCLVEVRLKDLVPVFDYLPSPRSQNARTFGQDRSPRYVNSFQNGDVLSGGYQPSISFEKELMNNSNGFKGISQKNSDFLNRSQSSSYQSSENGNYVASSVLNNNSEDTIIDDSPKIKSIVTGCYVNSNDDSFAGTDQQLDNDDQLVNNNNNRDREDDMKMRGAGAQFKFVNNYHEAPRSEADEFD